MPHDQVDFQKKLTSVVSAILEVTFHPSWRGGYTGDDDIHEKVVLSHRGYEVEIDKKLANTITVIWQKGWQTIGSCECYKDGKAYLQFLAPQFGGDGLCSLLDDNGIKYDRIDDKSRARIGINCEGKQAGEIFLIH